MPDSPTPAPVPRKTRHCVNCGAEFTPFYGTDRYCGAPDCEREAINDERAAYAERREAAEADDYGRY